MLSVAGTTSSTIAFLVIPYWPSLRLELPCFIVVIRPDYKWTPVLIVAISASGGMITAGQSTCHPLNSRADLHRDLCR